MIQQSPGAASDTALGVAYAIASAIGYTSANLLLRSVHDADPAWVSCVKTSPTLLAIAPWLLLLLVRGETIWRPGSFWPLVGIALWGNMLGNLAFQYSLSIIGVALTAPITLGTIIVMGAVLGRLILGESVSVRGILSIGVLLTSIAVLSLGAQEAQRALAAERLTAADEDLAVGESAARSLGQVALGVTAACLAGVCFGSLGVAIRAHLRSGGTLPGVIFVVSLIGCSGLAVLSWQRIGWTGMQATSGSEWLRMLGAGVANAIAFLAIGKALQHAPVVVVNGINASQAALCAIGGVLVFQEPPSRALVWGAVLTVAGLLLMRAPPAGPPDTPPEQTESGDA